MYVELTDKEGHLRHRIPIAALLATSNYELLLIEMQGAETACRAVWAHLHKKRDERSLQDTNVTAYLPQSCRLRVQPGTRYLSHNQTNRMLLAHPDFSPANSPTLLLHGSRQEPSPYFHTIVHLIPVPILPHWYPTVWRAAIDKSIVSPVYLQHGVTAWRIDYTASLWEALIVKLVKSGACQ